MRGFNRLTLMGIALLGCLLLGLAVAGFAPPADPDRLSYTAFIKDVKENQVASVTIRGHEITGTFGGAHDGGRLDQARQFTTVVPDAADPGLMPLLEAHHVTVTAKADNGSEWGAVLGALLPWVIIFGLLFFVGSRMARQEGGQGSLFGFGKSRAKRYIQNKEKIIYDDVAGLENAKKELQEIVAYMKDPRRFMGLGATLPKGILLIGPPGVGKTLMARATAGEAGVPFFSISGSEFIEMFVGVGASRVRDMFNEAKQVQPAIIFIDELDSIGRLRGISIGGGHDEREQTLNQILSEMDGFTPRHTIIVIAATNRPEVLDPALVRPGRFDRRITLDLPQKGARLKILQAHTRNVPLAPDVQLAQLAERTAGMSGADLHNMVNEAALLAARDRKRQVAAVDFEKARDKVIMGIEREDVISPEEKRIVAYHEAGHALVATLQKNTDPLRKVTIIPRGRALGATEQSPAEDRHNLNENYLLESIAVLLSGRVAEMMTFGELSTGAGDDLKRVARIARRMVREWGMSRTMGPVMYSQGETQSFLGETAPENREYSEKTARMIDEEVFAILSRKEKDARDLLSAHRDKLRILAEALLERETLDKDEIDTLLEQTDSGRR